MASGIRSCIRLLGRIALIQILTCLLGVCLINMVFDPLGGEESTSMLCLCMMLSWFLWGWITPKMAPVMMTVSHLLLPVIFGLGMLLSPPRKDK